MLADLRKGRVKAFEEIFRRYWLPLYNSARNKLRSHDEAEEVIQGIFSTLWEKRQSLLITNLPYYLNTSLRNRIINIIRNRIPQEKYWDYYKTFIPQQGDITEQAIAFDDLKNAVELAVNHLPEKSREVFRLSRLEGRSNAEIAGLLNVSEKAIEYHLTKSLKQLRVQLKDFIS
ncbi:MAG TPA: RNA polymerase sigma-70 factor [Chryseosolibacter sp.]